jgi:hypothetical protein
MSTIDADDGDLMILANAALSFEAAPFASEAQLTAIADRIAQGMAVSFVVVFRRDKVSSDERRKRAEETMGMRSDVMMEKMRKEK